ncbi:hypothetical protein J2S00_001732 [Caldalkalibacillus uzonensis]|uniref:Uncharacterized protein n=1 Tax=Caldalkalibacillus uzonensis TaxID=353224 RepID=A0ABU0CR92_9BACI|nr:hypothetical protein [Caldalkalibacillus uzonensis]MDQ0338946.1 hypothetical protein [Caldalkalibacillus uzonensis]
MSYYYHLCRRNIGRGAIIRTRDGREFRGIISRVTPTHVLLTPMSRRVSGKTAEGVRYEAQTAKTDNRQPEGTEILWGWWLPFLAISSLAFLPFFLFPFWW